MLQESEIDLLRTTPLVMLKRKEAAAELFYDTLFEMSPQLRALFPPQMSDQAQKFAATLVVAINSLTDWDALRPVVEALARRHLSYGVEAEHYAQVGDALMATLRKFDAQPEELLVWGRVYKKLSSHMIATAYPTVSNTSLTAKAPTNRFTK